MVSKAENPNLRVLDVARELPEYRRNGMTSAEYLNRFSPRTFPDAIEQMIAFSHGISYLSGWYHDPRTGEEIEPPERFGLMHSEISEALEADRKGLMDDKLPHRLGVEVELADLLHRVFDYAGRHGLDLAGAYFEKACYNVSRKDHKPEGRLAEGGASY